MFGSKSVQPISGVGSGMDQGQLVLVSDLGSVLPGLIANRGRQCTRSGRIRTDPFTKWIGLGHGRPGNYLGRVEPFEQINGSGRVLSLIHI